ncbi:MAG: hypothetical protein R3E83_05600 [Burkholderiaceae bacterium]
MGVDAVLDRRRRHVFALGGLELLLGAAGDLQQAVLADLAEISGAEEAVLGEGLGIEIRAFVLAGELRR